MLSFEGQGLSLQVNGYTS